MDDIIQRHLETVENLQAELEHRIKKALGDVSAEEILNWADELPQEIADELANWIEHYMLSRLADEAIRFMEEIQDEEDDVEVDEERVKAGLLLLLDHYRATIATIATAVFSTVKLQADLQEKMGRPIDRIIAELEDGTAGIGKEFASLGRKIVVATDEWVASAGGIVTLTSARSELTWYAVQDSKVCNDCAPRHGQSKSAEEWVALGLPRSGWSVCGGYCRCVLVFSKKFEKAGSPSPVVRKRRNK